MKHLPSEQKTFIVMQLAAFRTPTEIQKELRRQFSAEVSTSHICRYLPTCKAGATLSAPLRSLFEATRQQVIVQLAAEPRSGHVIPGD